MSIKVQYESYQGRYRQNNGVWSNVSYSIPAHDLIGSISTSPGIDHPFEAFHRSYEGGRINGFGGFNEWDECPSIMHASNKYGWRIPSTSVANESIRAMAATNPSRAQVLLPVFAWELKDLPDMIRVGARVALSIHKRAPWRNHVNWTKPSNVAAANLAVQFGILPFVSDMASIAMLGDGVNKRRDELARLASPKGLRRRIGLGSSSLRIDRKDDVPFWSTGGFLGYTWTWGVETFEAWATVDWRLNSDQSYLKDPFKPMDAEIRTMLLGLRGRQLVESAWEAIPWSWLVDWFIPIQSAIAAKNHNLASPHGGCLMAKRTMTLNWGGRVWTRTKNRPGGSLSPGTEKQIRHWRTLLHLNSLPQAHIPLLGYKQSSVLGSLLTLRAR